MAYNKSTQSPTLLTAVGQSLPIAAGLGTASSTTLTVTVPQFTQVHGAIGISLSSTTTPIFASSSGNVFTMTTGSAEVIAWMAWGIPKA